jgi:hypothetical protein
LLDVLAKDEVSRPTPQTKGSDWATALSAQYTVNNPHLNTNDESIEGVDIVSDVPDLSELTTEELVARTHAALNPESEFVDEEDLIFQKHGITDEDEIEDYLDLKEKHNLTIEDLDNLILKDKAEAE